MRIREMWAEGRRDDLHDSYVPSARTGSCRPTIVPAGCPRRSPECRAACVERLWRRHHMRTHPCLLQARAVAGRSARPRLRGCRGRILAVASRKESRSGSWGKPLTRREHRTAIATARTRRLRRCERSAPRASPCSARWRRARRRRRPIRAPRSATERPRGSGSSTRRLPGSATTMASSPRSNSARAWRAGRSCCCGSVRNRTASPRSTSAAASTATRAARTTRAG